MDINGHFVQRGNVCVITLVLIVVTGLFVWLCDWKSKTPHELLNDLLQIKQELTNINITENYH